MDLSCFQHAENFAVLTSFSSPPLSPPPAAGKVIDLESCHPTPAVASRSHPPEAQNKQCQPQRLDEFCRRTRGPSYKYYCFNALPSFFMCVPRFRKTRTVPVKTCPECGEKNGVARRNCSGCQYLFPKKSHKDTGTPSSAVGARKRKATEEDATSAASATPEPSTPLVVSFLFARELRPSAAPGK